MRPKGLLAVSVLCLVATLAPARAAVRPNFLLVFMDDQRYDAMSCAGHPFLKTPNMDRLAREGAYFRNAFVTTSLCSPSRASIQSGQYAHTHGVINNRGLDLRPDAVTFPKLLQKAGYQTAYVGKWHQSPTNEKRPGFDYWVSYRGQGVYLDPPINVNGRRVKATGYMDDIMTDYAIAWLTKERDKRKPFSLTLAFKAVHGPFTPPERARNLYSDAKVELPETFDEPLTNKPEFLRGRKARDNGESARMNRQEFIRKYSRTVRGADDNLGRMLDALQKEGLLDETLVIYTSDNGYYHGEHGGLSDKRSAYEESIRVPMLARYPRLIKPGSQIDGIALNIDIAPTFLAAAGVEVPETMQGRSLLPLFTGQAGDWRKSFFYEYFREPQHPNTPTIQAVRTDRYKYIRYLEPPDTPELYDLKNDPLETRNLHDDPASAEVLASMKKELERLIAETGAPATTRPAGQ